MLQSSYVAWKAKPARYLPVSGLERQGPISSATRTNLTFSIGVRNHPKVGVGGHARLDDIVLRRRHGVAVPVTFPVMTCNPAKDF